MTADIASTGLGKDEDKLVKDIFHGLGEKLGDSPESLHVWAALGMAMVLWVTWRAAHGDKNRALEFANSFHQRLKDQIEYNSDDRH